MTNTEIVHVLITADEARTAYIAPMARAEAEIAHLPQENDAGEWCYPNASYQIFGTAEEAEAARVAAEDAELIALYGEPCETCGAQPCNAAHACPQCGKANFWGEFCDSACKTAWQNYYA